MVLQKKHEYSFPTRFEGWVRGVPGRFAALVRRAARRRLFAVQRPLRFHVALILASAGNLNAKSALGERERAERQSHLANTMFFGLFA